MLLLDTIYWTLLGASIMIAIFAQKLCGCEKDTDTIKATTFDVK